jgi:hypothetical protein
LYRFDLDKYDKALKEGKITVGNRIKRSKPASFL